MQKVALPVFTLVACSGGGGAGTAPDASASDGSLDALSPSCTDAGAPPTSLECTGLYADFAAKTVAPGALSYTPAYPLWSDGAQKQRWIMLPAGTQIDDSDPNEWTFPVGTKIFKEFRVDGKRVETRMFQKTKTNFWVYATYAWNADDSAATINYGGPVPVGDSGVTWTIPNNDDCDECHRGRQDRILGFDSVDLGLIGAQGLTLADLVEMNLLSPPPASTSLTIGDDGTGLSPLAMGWLHVNCGVTCHNSNPSADGYGAGMILRLDPSQLDGSKPSPTTWSILKTTLGVPCVSGSVAGQPRIEPGDAKDSVLLQLINERGNLQMPPIASQIVDTTDVAVVAAWIDGMGGGGDAGPPPDQDSGPDAAMEAGPEDGSTADAAPEGGTKDAAVDASIQDAPAGDASVPDAAAVDSGSSDGASEGWTDAATAPDGS